MRVALYIVCWLLGLIGGFEILDARYMNDAIVGGILFIPALFSLVYLTTHK